MVSVEVTSSVTDGLLSANIDGANLNFVGGKATQDLEEGIEYALQWFVVASPGAKYQIAITKPPTVHFKHAATIDSSKKDAGVFWFTVPATAPAKAGTK